jgi:hypothetical protein
VGVRDRDREKTDQRIYRFEQSIAMIPPTNMQTKLSLEARGNCCLEMSVSTYWKAVKQ